ncbi:MAG: acyl-CoA dehydrogenase, partial [Acidimicrobiia bacterium]|nr:acyl-CoA dehydrogenase [Acidimicrobiia bacterium]
MSIDFSLSPELEAIRIQVRQFIDEVVRPAEQAIDENNRESLIAGIIK